MMYQRNASGDKVTAHASKSVPPLDKEGTLVAVLAAALNVTLNVAGVLVVDSNRPDRAVIVVEQLRARSDVGAPLMNL